SESEFAEEEQDLGLEPDEDTTGRCHAVLATGRRCPNAALPGSRYCGLPAHQALVEREQADAAEAPQEAPAAEAKAEAAATEAPEEPAPDGRAEPDREGEATVGEAGGPSERVEGT